MRKWKEICLPFAVPWMDLEIIILSGVSQKDATWYHFCVDSNIGHKWTFLKQTQTHGHGGEAWASTLRRLLWPSPALRFQIWGQSLPCRGWCPGSSLTRWWWRGGWGWRCRWWSGGCWSWPQPGARGASRAGCRSASPWTAPTPRSAANHSSSTSEPKLHTLLTVLTLMMTEWWDIPNAKCTDVYSGVICCVYHR